MDFENEYNQQKQQNEMLAAQLDAHKSLLSEQLQAGLNLRTSLVLVQKKVQDLEKKLASLTNDLKLANDRINELTITPKELTNASDKKPK